jgi:hypothetical protein
LKKLQLLPSKKITLIRANWSSDSALKNGRIAANLFKFRKTGVGLRLSEKVLFHLTLGYRVEDHEYNAGSN